VLVGVLPLDNLDCGSICIGMMGASIYSSEGVGKGVHDEAQEWEPLWDYCKRVVAIGPGHAFLHLVVRPMMWLLVRSALHYSHLACRLALKAVISLAVSSQALARMEAV